MPPSVNKWGNMNWPMQGCTGDMLLKPRGLYSEMMIEKVHKLIQQLSLESNTDWMTELYKSYERCYNIYPLPIKYNSGYGLFNWSDITTPKKEKPMATITTVTTYWIYVLSNDTTQSWSYYADRSTLADAESLADKLLKSGSYSKAMVSKACSVFEAPKVLVTRYA